MNVNRVRSLLWLMGLLLAAARVSAMPPMILHVGKLLTLPDRAPLATQSVVIQNGRISAIRAGYLSPQQCGVSDAVVVDLQNRFVMAGMIDAHVHLTLSAGMEPDIARTTNSELAVTAVDNARRTLMAGFTTVRDLGAAHAEPIMAVRDGIQRGAIPGPRILAAGVAISATAGHGDIRGLREDVAHVVLPTGICDGADECRRAVRLQYKQRADVIKIHVTGGGGEANGGRDAAPEMFEDEIRAVVETAHRLGLRVAAHAHGVAGINAALRGGVDSVEHSTWLDDQSIGLYASSGAYMVPTLNLLEYLTTHATNEVARSRVSAFAEQIMTRMARAHSQGVKFAMGSDAGISPHGEQASELLQYVRLGMTPAEALAAATVNAATLLGLEKDIGTVEAGKAADLIATAANPLDNVAALRRVSFVMRAGVVFKNE